MLTFCKDQERNKITDAERDRFKIGEVRLKFNDWQLLTCMRYIEPNPVRAGIVKRAREYPWSSDAVNAFGKESELIGKHKLCRQLDFHAELFRAAINGADLKAIRESANKGGVLGNGRFCEKIKRL